MKSSKYRGPYLVLALLALFLAGCGVATPSPRQVPAKGEAAPEISGENQDGKPMKLSDFRGKVVLLDFWRTD